MRFLISGIKPIISVTTEIAPKGVGAARNYATSTIVRTWEAAGLGVGAARNYATSTIRITTLTITFHVR